MSETKSMREAFGEAMYELGGKNPAVVVLTADLAESIRLTRFLEKYTDRFFNVGVAEADLIGISAGLALEGFIPFACSFAVFLPGRCYDHIRLSVSRNQANVKLVGSHAGLSNPGDGVSAQSFDDIALMRELPGMTVIVPADANQVKQAVMAMAEMIGPVYLRLNREPSLVLPEKPFEVGKGQLLREGKGVTIVACGAMVPIALEAAEEVDGEVINMHTIKPLDEEMVLKSVKKTGKVVTVEEHSVIGGLGSAVSEVLSEKMPVPMKIIGIEDRFGQSARTNQELLEEYGLTVGHVVQECEKLIS